MKKYIFAFDLDGTLLTDQQKVHPETLEAIQKAANQGHIMVIATGRPIKNVKMLIKEIPNISYIVSNNGAIVYDVKKDNFLALHHVSPKYYDFVHKFSLENGGVFKMHTDQDWIGYKLREDEKPLPLTSELNEKILEHIKNNPNDHKLFNGHTITQLSIYKEGDFWAKNYHIIAQKMEKDCEIYIANSVFIDINPKGCSKWSGLLEIAQLLNITNDQIVTFGDSGNDYEMLFNAKENGYAMSNSHPDLTAKIKPRIGSNNSNAIGLKILEYLNKM